jgi:hypothetical protein
MSLFYRYPLKVLNNRRLHLWGRQQSPKREIIEAGPAIKKILRHPHGMIYGKLGTTELQALEYSDRRIRSSWLLGATWRRQARRLFIDSGVFPEDRNEFEYFLNTYKASIQQLDAVCLWQDQGSYLQAYETAFVDDVCPRAASIKPAVFWPFSIYEQLEGVRLLIVSPFVRTMQAQVDRLPDVFSGRSWANSLKDMRQRCKFVRCPFFSYMEKSPYTSWREGLDRITEAILRCQFDLALIGAGAWSLPLLANLKKEGRKGIHTGGSTQLFFGIRGKRWDVQKGYKIFNANWIHPLPEDTPGGHLRKEEGCYW